MTPRFVAALLFLVSPTWAATVEEAVHARVARDRTVRVLVEFASTVGMQSRASRPGMETMHVLQTIPAMVATVTAEGLAQLEADRTVLTITADRAGGGGSRTSLAQIRADRVRNRGITGAGTVVAILDSGIDASHPDVRGAIVGEECFCSGGCCPGEVSRASGPGSAAGIHPHGVHVAGIVASRGHVAPAGVAPATGLLAVRVLDDDNRGFLSDWLAALDWVAANRPDARVINMSLVSDDLFTTPCDTADAFTRGFAQITATLRARGTLVVAASGNDGSTTMLTAPGCVANMVTVGAVDAEDDVADFSNGGAGVDLVAPGVTILSDAPNGVTGVLSGTSMAAAHVSGVLALLLEARPGIGGDDLEKALRRSGAIVVDPRTRRVVPRVDAFASLTRISAGAELVRGGGSRGNDCLLEWSIVPPGLAHGGRRSVAECVDNDVLCDLDQIVGQCTFLLSACFNQNDPLLPDCAFDETIAAFTLTSPDPAAPAQSRERINADGLLQSLPGFPLPDANACGVAFPLVVPVAQPLTIRASATTATRRDYDRISLRCR